VTATYQALLQRELRFRALALRSVVVQALGFASAILLVRAGYGVYGLVGYFLTVRVLDAVGLGLLAWRLPGR
jgi:O-antigen/teichoic acid export membrane protein